MKPKHQGGYTALHAELCERTLVTLLQQRLQGGLNRLSPAVRLPLGPLRKLSPYA